MIQLFRLAGIPVRIDFGWVLIFGLISWSLASGYFPRVVPELSPAAYWAHGLVAAALLFVSVFLHELSHALVARRQGVGVAAIVLHIFGGVSQLENEPPTPRAEFLIAVVGPLTSFAIAGVCFAAGRTFAGPPWTVALLGYLVVVNFLVGIFNLVPGFPLDGGRILRALLWAWNGRLGWATRVASRSGSVFALLLMALGVARTFGGEVMGGLWFIMIGLFLHQAAQSSFELSRVRARLEPVRVEDVMTPSPVAVAPDLPLAAVVADYFRRHRFSSFPVRDDDGRVLGVVTWPQVERAAAGGVATVADVMIPVGPDLVVGPRDSAWAAFLKISRNRVGRVVVVDGATLVGIVSHRDLHHALAAEGLRARLGRAA